MRSAHKTSSFGLTLIEILIVVAIFGLTIVPLLLTYRSYRTSQALASSTEAVANHTKSVHIFAREAQKQREWGIKNLDETRYTLYSSGASGIEEEQNYSLDAGVSFEDDFDVLFHIGTGQTDQDYEIKILNVNGRSMSVLVKQTGVVEVNTDP